MLTTPAQQDLARFNADLVRMGESPRYWRINRLEQWYLGTQYDTRPSFWSQDVPLRERAPVVQSQFTRSAVQRLATLVFGDRSFPRLKVEAEGYRTTLATTERDALQALVDEIARTLALSKRMREVLTEGLKSGAACIIVGLVEGRPSLQVVPSKWCTPVLRADGSVEAMCIEYKVPGDDPKRWRLHRREITATEDRTYAPVDVVEGTPPRWGDYTSIPVECCPVVWVRNDAEATATRDQIDGHALVEGLEDEVEALDMELSQLYRNALYNGEPQLVQIGVDGDASMTAPQGRTAGATEERFSWLNSVLPGWARSGNSSAAAKKAPGKLWKLPQGGDAKMVESTGAGAEIIRGAITELRRVLTDASGVVLFDADSLGGGDLAARTLQLMHAPMLDHADNLRVEYGDALARIVDMMLRVLSGRIAQTMGALLRTYDRAAPALARLYGIGPDGTRRWIGVPVTLAWGDYFEPSAMDRKSAVETALLASGGAPVLSHRSAVASIAAMFGVQDVDAEVESAKVAHAATQGIVSDAITKLSPDDDAPELTLDDTDPMPAAVADTALNGAQVASMVEVVEKVAAGTLPRGAARAIIMRAFAVDGAGADEILGDAGQGFVPAAQTSPARDDGGTLGG